MANVRSYLTWFSDSMDCLIEVSEVASPTRQIVQEFNCDFEDVVAAQLFTYVDYQMTGFKNGQKGTNLRVFAN